MKKCLSLFFVAWFISVLFWPSLSDCSAATVERCKKYLPQVIRESRVHFGIDSPYYYFLAQVEIESGCNEKITAFDGGMGLAQFMPTTAQWIHEKEKSLQEFQFNPYDPRWSIRALILYDKWCYSSVFCKDWYFAFRAYNGGAGLLNKEIHRAGSCSISEIEKQCKRKTIVLKNGQRLDFCQVNINYPAKIFKASKKYKR